MGLNMKERKPLLREAGNRYQEAGTKKEKSAILDELVGYTKMTETSSKSWPTPGKRRRARA